MGTMRFNKSYETPRQPFEVSGRRYALPSDFVDGLSFLRRFVSNAPVTTWNVVESRVHIIGGNLYLLTNNLIVSYEIGECAMPNYSFSVRAIRTLEAFGAPPSSVEIDGVAVFHWDDGQDVRMEAAGRYQTLGLPGLNEKVVGALDHYWRDFSKGVTPTDDERADIRKRAHRSQAVFLRPEGVLACSSRDGKDWTLIAERKFATGLKGTKRVDPKAFCAMMQIADEIAFDSNPICFRHANGRGVLIEKTLGSNMPDFDEESPASTSSYFISRSFRCEMSRWGRKVRIGRYPTDMSTRRPTVEYFTVDSAGGGGEEGPNTGRARVKIFATISQ